MEYLIILVFSVSIKIFIDLIFKKFRIFKILREFGAHCKYKVIYNLTKCDFCISFHIGFISFIIVILFYKMDVLELLTPPAIVGVLKLLNYDYRN